MTSNDTLNKIVSLTKRRGFIFQSSEIYGGLKSAYDYGPLGVELKRNIAAEVPGLAPDCRNWSPVTNRLSIPPCERSIVCAVWAAFNPRKDDQP